MTKKRDYYEVLAVERTRVRGRDQTRLSQARGQISSRQESGRPARRRKIQGTRRSLRRPDGCRQTRRLRSLRSCRFRSRHCRRGGGFHDPFDIFREVFGGGGAAEFSKRSLAAAAPTDREGRQRGPICVTTCRSRSRKRPLAWRRKSNSQARHLRQMQRHRRGSRFAHDQLSDLRRPRPGHQFARIFSGFANLSALPRRRPDHRETVPECAVARVASKSRAGSN